MEREFMAVPVSYLELDPETSRGPAKMSRVELQQAMATVPEIYRMQLEGVGEQEFFRMANCPGSDREQIIGSTYRHLFSNSPSAQPLRCEFVDGSGLLVVAGQHRVIEARELGIPYLPMHVSFPNPENRDRIERQCDDEVRRLTPDLARVPELHLELTPRFYPRRDGDGGRYIDGYPRLDKAEPERENNSRVPERER